MFNSQRQRDGCLSADRKLRRIEEWQIRRRQAGETTSVSLTDAFSLPAACWKLIAEGVAQRVVDILEFVKDQECQRHTRPTPSAISFSDKWPVD